MSRRSTVFTRIALLVAPLVTLAGCAAPLFSGASDPAAMNLKEPDAAFMKKVEKDPFPRAGNTPPLSR